MNSYDNYKVISLLNSGYEIYIQLLKIEMYRIFYGKITGEIYNCRLKG